jgi:hypothetical protein
MMSFFVPRASHKSISSLCATKNYYSCSQASAKAQMVFRSILSHGANPIVIGESKSRQGLCSKWIRSAKLSNPSRLQRRAVSNTIVVASALSHIISNRILRGSSSLISIAFLRSQQIQHHSQSRKSSLFPAALSGLPAIFVVSGPRIQFAGPQNHSYDATYCAICSMR